MQTITYHKKSIVRWLFALGLPTAGIALFYLLRDDTGLMTAWRDHFMGPAEQFLGRIWAVFPFSVAEVLIALSIAAIVIWLVRAVYLLVRQREKGTFFRRLLALCAAAAWFWCGLCWSWNAGYYARSFTQQAGLESRGHSIQELVYTTVWFAQKTAALSTQVQRDDQGRFAVAQEDYFRRGVDIYENISKEFPCLEMDSVRTKPLVCSRLQSILGFTGLYFPFTGEANVNVDAPACLRPATIAHEMAHQRMVASELEAQFVGIAAAVSSDDVVFQYSGYLLGLLELSNALYDISPELWSEVINACFTDELRTDWNENHYYWKALESEVEEAAEQTYDSYLKGNGQVLGIASYGACVDLLITYYLPRVLSGLI